MANLGGTRPTNLLVVRLGSSLGIIPFSLGFAGPDSYVCFSCNGAQVPLAKLAAVIATHAFAENTNKGYASHIKSWLLFCLYFDFPTLPATDAGLCQNFGVSVSVREPWLSPDLHEWD